MASCGSDLAGGEEHLKVAKVGSLALCHDGGGEVGEGGLRAGGAGAAEAEPAREVAAGVRVQVHRSVGAAGVVLL